MKRLLPLTAFAFCFATNAIAQFNLPGGGRIDIKLPSLSDLTKKEKPLSISIKDIKHWGFPELDGTMNGEFTSLTEDDRNAKGSFTLAPGYYQMKVQAFCGRGYTWGPTKGDGYLFGEWKGSKASLLKDLLNRYNLNDNVSQRDMQLLIWSILARVKPEKMQGGAKRALLELMGEDGVKLMADGALDYFEDRVSRELFKEVNSTLRPVLIYENKMRSLFYKANRDYNEFERLAMIEPPAVIRSEIPEGRWNIHPEGYAFRFTARSYRALTLQVVVPRTPIVVRDTLKRITSVKIGDDFHFQITYDDSVEPLTIAGEANLKGYAVKHVTSLAPHATNKGETVVYDKDTPGAWVFMGAPKRKSNNQEMVTQFLRVIRDNPEPQGRFDGWRSRYDDVQELDDRIETYEEYAERMRRIREGERPDDDVFNGDHIKDLIDSLFGGTDDRLEQIGDTHSRLAEWLAHATELIDSLGEEEEVDPGDDGVAVPGATGGQLLIPSTRAAE